MLYYTQLFLFLFLYIPLRILIGKYKVMIDDESELESKPLIIVMNHNSRIDPLLLLLLPFRVVKKIAPIKFMTAKYYFRIWWLRMIIQPFGAYPLKKTAWTFEDYFTDSLHILSKGGNILIFPEGKVVNPKNKKEVRPGIGFVVSKSELPVLPVRIAGSETITVKNFLSKRIVLILHIGKLFKADKKTTDYTNTSATILNRIYSL